MLRLVPEELASLRPREWTKAPEEISLLCMPRYIASLYVLWLAAAVYPSPLAAIAPEADARACASRAFMNHAKATVDIFKGGMPDGTMTTEATVALRRLEESLCHKVASCVTGTNATRDSLYRTTFSTCLRDQVLERLEKK